MLYEVITVEDSKVDAEVPVGLRLEVEAGNLPPALDFEVVLLALPDRTRLVGKILV